MRWMMLLGLIACAGTSDDDNGAGDDTTSGSCDVPCQISTAASGDSCQVNLFCTTDEPAAYCSTDAEGTTTCNCGAAVDNPPSFTSEGFCDLDMEAAACEAMTQCSNWTFN